MIYYCKNFASQNRGCIIIVAPNRIIAEALLEEELAKQGLTQRSDWSPRLVEVDTASPHCILIDME